MVCVTLHWASEEQHRLFETLPLKFAIQSSKHSLTVALTAM